MTFRAAAGGAISAGLLVLFAWNAHAHTYDPITTFSPVLLWGLVFLPAFALLLWSVVARRSWLASSYVWTRRIVQLHAILAAATFLFGCIADYAFTAPISPAFFSIIAAIAVATDAVVLGVAPRADANAETIRNYRTATLLIAGGVAAAIPLWALANIAMVVTQAQIAASGRPYCLQVAANNTRYRPVGHLMELNGLKMHAPLVGGAPAIGNTRFTI